MTTQNTIHCPGWTADWISGWLAAIGCTATDETIKLSWSHDPRPHATFHLPPGETLTAQQFAERIAQSMPPFELVVDRLEPFFTKQEPTLLMYQQGSIKLRNEHDWLIPALVTDCGPTNDPIERSLFYPGAPGKADIIKRLTDIGSDWANSDAILASINGRPARRQQMGLAFDPRRIVDATNPNTNVYVDAAVELLGFCALMLFPTRGNGRNVRTRRDTPQGFTWAIWHHPLDVAAIDAVLQPNVIAPTFELVRYRPRGKEVSAGYFSKRYEQPTAQKPVRDIRSTTTHRPRP